MIFVTVGTHEQPFDRLVQCIDDLVADGTLCEEVIIQTGFSTYIPQHCQWQAFFPYSKMISLVEDARIVITHGGPSSFKMVIQKGKIPVVVPRMKRYGEHVNNHQFAFCRQMSCRNCNILLVEDITQMRDILTQYDVLTKKQNIEEISNSAAFNRGIQEIVDNMFHE